MQPLALNYGSDQSGLICGFRFAPGLPGVAIESAGAVAWLAGDTQSLFGEFVWLHFNLANASTERWAKANLPLPEAFFDSLHDGTNSTRVEFVEQTLFAVMNDVLFDFAYDASHISTLWLSVSERLLVSARYKPLRTVDRLRANVRGGAIFRSPVDMLAHLLRDQADELMQIVRTSVAKVDTIEDALVTERLDYRRSKLGPLRRVLIRLQRLLAPEPAALFRLLSRPPAWMAEADAQELRAATEEFSVALSDMGSLQERIKLLQEEVAARINQQTSRNLFMLTIVTVLALPINIIAGLFGMNVGGIPLAQDAAGFWTIVAIVATFTVGAGVYIARRRRDD